MTGDPIPAAATPDLARAYALTDDDINEIADHIAGRDLREMRIPNGSVAGLITLLRDARAEVEQLRAERDSDVRAVAALAAAEDGAPFGAAVSDLIARFADRIEALEVRDTKGSGDQ